MNDLFIDALAAQGLRPTRYLTIEADYARVQCLAGGMYRIYELFLLIDEDTGEEYAEIEEGR
jgi:hypothetical protein